MTAFKYFDLFAGIGGFREAASEISRNGIGMESIGYCEIDQACVRVFDAAHLPDRHQELFISDVKDILDKHGNGTIPLPEFEILMAGFPCEAFSNVGRREGFSDSRGALFFDVVRLLETYRPKFFFLENVQKIATINKGQVLSFMLDQLENAGYESIVWDLDAADYGVPQHRRRLFFCGANKDSFAPAINIPTPPIMRRTDSVYPTVWHLMERHMDQAHVVPHKTRETVFKRNPKWMGRLDTNLPVARPITATMGKWHRANQDNYYSYDYLRPDNHDPFVSPEVNVEETEFRRITPLEALRLQGFDDRFADCLSNLNVRPSPAYRLIGNAVPVPMAAAVMEHFIRQYI